MEIARKNNTNDHSPLKLAFVGDICLAGGLQQTLYEKGSDFPFLHVREIFKTADLVIGNLECCVGGSIQDITQSKKNIMTVPESLFSGFVNSGVNIVSLSNNHILDGGESGLIATQQLLNTNGILHFGAGSNIHEAEEPLIVECKNQKLAFLGACDVPQVLATNNRGGSAALDAKSLRRRIRECKNRASKIIVILHADLEFVSYPSPGRVKLSRWLIDEGADLVIQHHPHVCQGIEHYKTGLIAYSLGNFIFKVHGHEYLEGKSGTDQSFILQVELDDNKKGNSFSYTAIPVIINKNNQTVLSDLNSQHEQLAQLTFLSSGLKDTRLLRRERFNRCKNEAKSNIYNLYYILRRKGLFTMCSVLLSILGNSYHRKWIYSFLSFGFIE